MDNNLLEIKNLYVEYQTDKGYSGEKQIIHAVNGVNLNVKKGEILAIAGESGCGKSTLAKTIIRLEKAKSGKIIYENKNILEMNKKELKNYRKNAQMVFQNPYASLNPKMKIKEILQEPLKINTNFYPTEIDNIIKEKLNEVGLAEKILDLYPHEFSGGQRQRIAIARALLLTPEIILADEPVSALDVSIQAQIINLLKHLKETHQLTFILITHDMSVIKYLADRVAIMYLGEIVEIGDKKQIFSSPKHPYTKALLSAAPQINGTPQQRIQLSGEIPSPSNLPQGCKFHARCPEYIKDVCDKHSPCLTQIEPSHNVKCFLYENKKSKCLD